MDNEPPSGDGDTFASICAAVFMVALLYGAVILARDQCWVQLPSLPQWPGPHGSPTLIEEIENE